MKKKIVMYMQGILGKHITDNPDVLICHSSNYIDKDKNIIRLYDMIRDIEILLDDDTDVCKDIKYIFLPVIHPLLKALYEYFVYADCEIIVFLPKTQYKYKWKVNMFALRAPTKRHRKAVYSLAHNYNECMDIAKSLSGKKIHLVYTDKYILDIIHQY